MARDRIGDNVTSLDVVRESAANPERQPSYTVKIRDLVLNMFIGVHEFEKAKPQRVKVSVELTLDYPEEGIGNHYSRVFCYETFIGRIRMIAEAGHVLLVEGFAERICDLAFDDRRIRAVKVEVEKLDIFSDAAGVGTLIEKFRPQD
ncbi:dihydroneopterin aldolase [Nisaea acidiphila]|uniref:dihydroneopterin aldolase n=1 Tax=Nisaea acidiphila TaxID=1862145 RepID=A0A9J7AX20_9PROT|nr:dihydroneopterin aldolase [Nisaea acidiphila]UUX51670.1 dihydroneopterin aldolase [Nisaea acidiphila]